MFDRAALAHQIARHGSVVRVVVAKAEGSAPREAGAAMIVWEGGQSGTIGGGALEYEAAARARARLSEPGARWLRHEPLGPALGQCCGGAVTLAYEVFDAATLPDAAPSFQRSFGTEPCPASLTRLAQRHAASGDPVPVTLSGHWLAEPMGRAALPVWIYGGGHVGRAIAAVLAPLPEFAPTLIDIDSARLPDPLPEGTESLIAAHPTRLVAHAPQEAQHLVLTHSHALDLELCHALLTQSASRIGLIGSATKWARFRKRLATLGHPQAAINCIECPIGDPALGKHPQAIAVSVAAALLKRQNQQNATKDVA
ncbi:xanthine dehydrogenase accessory protein XdhC [Pseudoruegeria sp. SHC-113]|uniref:xanthine dehydrogenase accessory protein XdhC n=1 Tax=Pseudoruegeria sp. SHC-113 TaxID=2855439 RepID=UPI0021BB6387|nr:xanthine dehydrogenase accessory protein XdhC [Pseudoruegeria sp. SHC-113]MCT8161191.1 xanthine dehydrogenase accessory protein XdhC [Pseudoruegeria sp. SHC-113]